MSKEPFISIIVVTYQAGKTLHDCIQSVFNQPYLNRELIVIDGGSKDETLAIIKENELHISYFVSESDAGIYDAMNKGIKQAKGDYLYFLGADDVLLPNLHLVAKQLQNTNDIYYGDVLYKNSKVTYGGAFSVWDIVVKNICHQAIFYPKSVFNKYAYSLQYPLLADYYLNLQLMADSGFQFKYLNLEVCIYNEHGSSGLNLDKKFIEDKLALIKSHYAWPVFAYAWLRKLMAKYVFRKQYYQTA